jgi:hypothetical protein
MSTARRPQLDDRRRMVIYSQRFADDEGAQTKRARGVDPSVKAARRPVSAYGWRVQRRLRARWYGLVPVRRRALWAVTATMFAAVLLLAAGHWASLMWAPIAYRPEIARPLRLDRPDSFGTWLGSVMLLFSAGISFLIYQLRRYRADDYHGHYRLWRIAILVFLLASLDSVVQFSNMLGGLIDVALAQREVLAGADWMRLLVGIGGAAFGLRMMGELWRDRWAAGMMFAACLCLAVGPAQRWHVLGLDSLQAVFWVPIALLMGRTLMTVTAVVHLRTLYREVRKFEASQRVRDQLLGMLPKWPQRKPKVESEAVAAPVQRRARKAVVVESKGQELVPKNLPASKPAVSKEPEGKEVDRENSGHKESGTQRRRWPFSRTAKATVEPTPAAKEVTATAPVRGNANVVNETEATAIAPRRWWKFGRKSEKEQAEEPKTEVKQVNKVPPAAAAANTKSQEPANAKPKEPANTKPKEPANTKSQEPAKEETETKRRFGFGLGLLGRRRTQESNAEEVGEVNSGAAAQKPNPVEKNVASSAPVVGKPAAAPSTTKVVESQREADEEGDDEGEEGEEDGVDWGGMNKSERRRMRKLMKRQGKAA